MKICIYKHNPSADVTLSILDAYERAFKNLGSHILVINQDMENYSREQARSFAKKFIQFKPEMAICYGFSAMPEINGSYFFRKRGIPLVVLCFENPFFGLNPRLFNEITQHHDYYYFFVWDSYYLNLLRQLFKNCHPIMHAAEVISSPDTKGDYKYLQHKKDVTFVGNIINVQKKKEFENHKAIDNFINDVVKKKMQSPEKNIINIISVLIDTLENFEVKNKIFSGNNEFFHKKILFPIYKKGLGYYRCTLLNKLNMFNVHYYGTSQWPAPHLTFHPPVSYSDQLNYIYASTKVNIDIPPLQSIYSVNNRFFDVGAAGSLLLTEKKSDLELIFDDSEAITYTSINQLREKIEFYLNNQEARNKIAQKMKRCVIESHTYFHRAEYILDTLSM